MTLGADALRARNRRAQLLRWHDASDPVVQQADAEYREALVEDRIRQLLSTKPPLSPDTRARLAQLLAPEVPDTRP